MFRQRRLSWYLYWYLSWHLSGHLRLPTVPLLRRPVYELCQKM